MPLPALGALLPVVGKVLDRVIPDKAAAAAAKLEMERLYVEGDLRALEADVALATAQLEVNKAEAGSSSLFVAGWRPMVGWVCALGFAWNFMLLDLYVVTLRALGLVVEAPAPLDTGDMMTLLLGMLGLGGYRTYEKLSGVARRNMAQ